MESDSSTQLFPRFPRRTFYVYLFVVLPGSFCLLYLVQRLGEASVEGSSAGFYSRPPP